MRRAPTQRPLAAVPAAVTPELAPQPAAVPMQPQEGIPSLDNISPAPVEANAASAVAPDDVGFSASIPPKPAGDEQLEPLTSLTPSSDSVSGGDEQLESSTSLTPSSDSVSGSPLLYVSIPEERIKGGSLGSWLPACTHVNVLPFCPARCFTVMYP